MKVQYFVLTRFNLRLESFISRFSGGRWKGGDEDYLEKRFACFERYCLPSMSRQKGPFAWLVFFSDLTPEHYKARARAYADACPGFEAVFVHDETPFDSKDAFIVLMDAIVQRLDPDTEYYIVSRIDNDDAFNVNALEWVRKAALEKISEVPCEKFYVVMPCGNAYIADGGFTQDYTWSWNHFPTLVCRRDVRDHPFSRGHDTIRASGIPVVRVPNRHAWLEVVNGTNAKNDLRTYCRPEFLSAGQLREMFAIDVPMSRVVFAWYWFSRYLPNKAIAFLQKRRHRKMAGRTRERAVTVVVPVYNGLEILERLCRTLFDNTDPMHRIVFVDDASPDSRIAPYLGSLAASHPNVCILRNDVNKGFPFTANRGAAEASGDFVLLNTDTEVPPGWIPRLFHPIWSDAGVASAMPLSNSWSSLKSAPGIVSIDEVERVGVAAIDKKIESVSVPSDLDEWKTNLGFCLAISGEAWRRVGPFDDKVFGSGYFEETDWCARARYRFGYRHVVASNVFVAHWHNGSFTPERKREQIAANREKMLSRNPEYVRDNARRYALSRRAVLDAAYVALHGIPRPKVSVVVPVCNVEKYLPRCLDSLIAQTLREIEIICVDDGSTDGSLAVLHAYEARDARIMVLHQANAGAGAARNAGLDKAAGEYLFFFDPDDSCEKDMLEIMYRRAKKTKADVVVAGKKVVDAETGELIAHKPLPRRLAWFRRQPFSPAVLADRIFSFAKAVPWDKLFRRAFVEENQLRFMALPRSNDVYFVDMSLALAKRIALVRKGYYHYSYRRGGSLTFAKNAYPLSTFEAYSCVEDALRQRGVFATFAENFAEVFLQIMLVNLKSLNGYEDFARLYTLVRGRLVVLAKETIIASNPRTSTRRRYLCGIILANESPDALWLEMGKKTDFTK